MAKPDYDLCTICTHTINIHTGKTAQCKAYQCSCKGYEGK